MIRSQIQLIADNLHNFLLTKKGDIYSAKKNYSYAGLKYIEIVSSPEETTMNVSGYYMGLTLQEQEFLCRVLVKCVDYNFINYEELEELIS